VATAIGAKDPTIKPMKADGWKQVGKQLGSNPGGFFEDDRGQEWYCKTPESEDHARNEILASKLYEELGIRAPEMKLISRKGKVGVASKIIPVLVKDKEALRAGLVPGALEGFAADAWLANWDSVGLSFDNMLVDGEGAAVRVDPGGALLYRARGAPKGKAFGDHVGEIDTLRDGSNAQAADVFQHVTDEHIAEGVRKIVGIPDDRIKELCSKFGPGSSKTRAALADRLIARKKDLAARFL
jgi:hypothetical protein